MPSAQNTLVRFTAILVLTCSKCGHQRTFQGFSFEQVLENLERDKWIIISDKYPDGGIYCPFCHL